MQYFKKLINKAFAIFINIVMPFDDRLVLSKYLIEINLTPKGSMMPVLGGEIVFMIAIIIIDFSETQYPTLTTFIYLLPSTMCLLLPALFFYYTKQVRIQIISWIFMLTSFIYTWFYLTIATVGVNPNLFLAIIDLLKYHGIYLLIFLVLYRIGFHIEMKYGSIVDFYSKHAKQSSAAGIGSFVIFYLILRNFPISFFLILIWAIKIIILIVVAVCIIEQRKVLRAITIMEQSEPPEIREARERAILEEKERKRKQKQAEKERKKKEKEQKKLYLEQQIKKDRAEMEKSKNQTEEKEIELWEV